VLDTIQKELGDSGRVSIEIVYVSVPENVTAATNATIERHSRIDILVANVGIAGPNHKSWEYPIDAWKRVIAARQPF
jgi:2-dehydro-3-deoxy-L-rhamnonate dehydrogenase (NAD+)